MKYNRYPSGYGIVQKQVMLMKDLSIQAKAVYALLAGYTGADSYCFPNQKTMAENFGCSTISIKRYIKELSKKNIVTIEKKNIHSFNKSNMYRLNIIESENSESISSDTSERIYGDTCTSNNITNKEIFRNTKNCSEPAKPSKPKNKVVTEPKPANPESLIFHQIKNKFQNIQTEYNLTATEKLSWNFSKMGSIIKKLINRARESYPAIPDINIVDVVQLKIEGVADRLEGDLKGDRWLADAVSGDCVTPQNVLGNWARIKIDVRHLRWANCTLATMKQADVQSMFLDFDENCDNFWRGKLSKEAWEIYCAGNQTAWALSVAVKYDRKIGEKK